MHVVFIITQMDSVYPRQVLDGITKAIKDLIPRIDKNYEEAVNSILSCKGQVILTGMGKAGIIAQKVSATFASTGTPSFFLHPAEAYHGDIGRVQLKDIVLVFSNSGETEEVVRLVPKLKAIVSKIISITASKNSNLGKYSDITLEIGMVEEPSHFGLAPSASTACMLALGDALALTVSKERGFSKDDFAQYHPGGDIGKRLRKVGEFMRTGQQNPIVDQESYVKEAIFKITESRAGAVNVVDSSGKLVGIFTDGDLRRNIAKDPASLNQKMKNVMTKSPLVITPDKSAQDAIKMLSEWRIDELPVVDESMHPIGMLDIQDLIKDQLV